MKVKVNQEACIGCGACLQEAGEVFEMNDEGFSSVKMAEITPELEESVRNAIDSCPTGAIEEE